MRWTSKRTLTEPANHFWLRTAARRRLHLSRCTAETQAARLIDVVPHPSLANARAKKETHRLDTHKVTDVYKAHMSHTFTRGQTTTSISDCGAGYLASLYRRAFLRLLFQSLATLARIGRRTPYGRPLLSQKPWRTIPAIP